MPRPDAGVVARGAGHPGMNWIYGRLTGQCMKKTNKTVELILHSTATVTTMSLPFISRSDSCHIHQSFSPARSSLSWMLYLLIMHHYQYLEVSPTLEICCFGMLHDKSMLAHCYQHTNPGIMTQHHPRSLVRPWTSNALWTRPRGILMFPFCDIFFCLEKSPRSNWWFMAWCHGPCFLNVCWGLNITPDVFFLHLEYTYCRTFDWGKMDKSFIRLNLEVQDGIPNTGWMI